MSYDEMKVGVVTAGDAGGSGAYDVFVSATESYTGLITKHPRTQYPFGCHAILGFKEGSDPEIASPGLSCSKVDRIYGWVPQLYCHSNFGSTQWLDTSLMDPEELLIGGGTIATLLRPGEMPSYCNGRYLYTDQRIINVSSYGTVQECSGLLTSMYHDNVFCPSNDSTWYQLFDDTEGKLLAKIKDPEDPYGYPIAVVVDYGAETIEKIVKYSDSLHSPNPVLTSQ